MTEQLLLAWPPVYRLSPRIGGKRWNGGNLR
jgi:hypothetical protein